MKGFKRLARIARCRRGLPSWPKAQDLRLLTRKKFCPVGVRGFESPPPHFTLWPELMKGSET